MNADCATIIGGVASVEALAPEGRILRPAINLNASKFQSRLVWISLGVTLRIFDNFERLEALYLQCLSRFYYKIAVSRCVTKLRLHCPCSRVLKVPELHLSKVLREHVAEKHVASTVSVKDLVWSNNQVLYHADCVLIRDFERLCKRFAEDLQRNARKLADADAFQLYVRRYFGHLVRQCIRREQVRLWDCCVWYDTNFGSEAYRKKVKASCLNNFRCAWIGFYKMDDIQICLYRVYDVNEIEACREFFL